MALMLSGIVHQKRRVPVRKAPGMERELGGALSFGRHKALLHRSWSSHRCRPGAGEVALWSSPLLFFSTGTATSCEALYMGVPLVTLKGEHHCQNVGASLNNVVGMPELSANTTGVAVPARRTARDTCKHLRGYM